MNERLWWGHLVVTPGGVCIFKKDQSIYYIYYSLQFWSNCIPCSYFLTESTSEAFSSNHKKKRLCPSLKLTISHPQKNYCLEDGKSPASLLGIGVKRSWLCMFLPEVHRAVGVRVKEDPKGGGFKVGHIQQYVEDHPMTVTDVSG